MQKEIFNQLLYGQQFLNFQRNPSSHVIARTLLDAKLQPFDIYFSLMMSDMMQQCNFTNDAYRIGVCPEYKQNHMAIRKDGVDTVKSETSFSF